MKVLLAGIGAWGPGFCSHDDFRTLAGLPAVQFGESATPKPQLIPARERRRAPLMVRLAVEVASQACRMAAIDPQRPACVFASGVADCQLTDYMCRVLAGADKQLSPTRFHNSVHNAAAGYWSISTGCEQPATFVASFEQTFSVALLEAVLQVQSSLEPVLLVMSEVPVPAPLAELHPVEYALGAALLLLPAGAGGESGRLLQVHTVEAAADWPKLANGSLRPLYLDSPAARIVALLEALCSNSAWDAGLPLGAELSLRVVLGAATHQTGG